MSANIRMHKAYSLIELIIAISVLTLLSSFVVPTYQIIMSQMQLGAAVDEVTDLLRLSEQKTVTEQKIYGVTLTANASTIPQYILNPDSTKTAQPTYTLPANIKIGEVNFSGNSDIRFSTSGAPNVSGNLVITDIARSRSRRIFIKPSGSVFATQGEF